MRKLYLAYGSNLNRAQMRFRCPEAKVVGTAFLEDHRLLFRKSKSGFYLTIEPETGSKVPVAVWEVTKEDERMLDRCEGFPTFYYKKEMLLPVKNICTGKTRRRRVFAYIMHENRPVGIPSRSYLRTCVNGYWDFGFDLNILADAYERSKENAQ